MNGYRSFLFTPSFADYRPPTAGHSSNQFPFNKFHTLMRDRSALNSFTFNQLRTTFITMEGWGMNPNIIRNSQPLMPVLCFQRLTHCPICNPFVLITLQQYPG
jgi:hypothetical protein